jgi:hypothetical protein
MKSIVRSSLDLLLRSTRSRTRIVTQPTHITSRIPALSLAAAMATLLFSACEPTFAQGPDGAQAAMEMATASPSRS